MKCIAGGPLSRPVDVAVDFCVDCFHACLWPRKMRADFLFPFEYLDTKWKNLFLVSLESDYCRDQIPADPKNVSRN